MGQPRRHARGDIGNVSDAEKLEVTVTDLAMTKAPHYRVVPRPPGKVALLLAEDVTVSYYRYLYNAVGERWFWWERRAMDDAALEAIIKHEKVEIFILYVGGVPAGFAELDFTEFDRDRLVDIAVLGLVPEYMGKGYGLYLANWVVDGVWRREPKRLTTRVTSFDHPRATGLLQQVGFTPVSQHIEMISDPRANGLIAADTPLPTAHHDVAAPPGPHAVITPMPRRRE